MVLFQFSLCGPTLASAEILRVGPEDVTASLRGQGLDFEGV